MTWFSLLAAVNVAPNGQLSRRDGSRIPNTSTIYPTFSRMFLLEI